MLAALTTNNVYIYDPSSFKTDIPASPLACQPTKSSATSLAWAEDKALYVAQKGRIQQYGASGNLEKNIDIDSNHISSFLIQKNGSAVCYIADGQAFYRDSGSDAILLAPEIPIVRWKYIVQSSDGLMLAIAAASTCIILDLSKQPSKSIILHGLASNVSTTNPITTISFHSHTTSTLLIGTKKHIIVYDVASPSEPLKTISLGPTSSASGDVVGITCSPFSKTLVAIACSGGSVHLIDLENSKGKLKAIDLKTPLTSAAFLRDGGAIVLGTDNGKLLILDLRAADKPPKQIAVSGERIVGVAIQNRTRSRLQSTATLLDAKLVIEQLTKKKGLAESTRPLAAQDTNNPRLNRRVSEASSKSLTPSSASSSAIQNKQPTNADIISTPGRKVSAAILKTRNVSSSRQIASKTSKTPTDSSVEPFHGVNGRPSRSTSIVASTGAPSSKSSSPRVVSTPKGKKDSTILGMRPAFMGLSTTPTAVTKTSPTLSSSTRNVAEIGGRASRSTTGAKTRVVSGSKIIASREPTPPVPALPSTYASDATTKEILDVKETDAKQSLRARTLSLLSNSTEHRGGLSRARSQASNRTLTPDLPSISNDPVSPLLPSQKIGSSTLNVVHSASSLDVKELANEESATRDQKGRESVNEDEYIENMRKKRVEFVKEAEIEDIEGDDVRGQAGYNEMQITPLRRRLSTNSMPMQVVSPFRNFVLATSPARGQSSGSSSVAVQELLRSVMQDVMYDFRQETHDGLVGLHLDMVRMGRMWKNELKTLTDEYRSDRIKLMEENQRLREENERLVRGY